MRNYLEHEEEVKYVDGILSKSQEWQWFIDCVEDNFDLNDIHSYSEFNNKNHPLSRILSNFVKIIEVCDKEWIFRTVVLNDIFQIARYSIGAIDTNECQLSVTSNIGRILFVAVWLTKLENADNKTSYVIDTRFFNLKNYHHAINMDSFIVEEDQINDYLETIDIEGFDSARDCIKDNLNKNTYGVSENFFDRYKDNLLSVNAFSYQHVEKDDYLTWQEQMLLDMISISIDRSTISPLYSNGKTMYPDYTAWTSDMLNKIKFFFNHPIADFIIESVDYVKNNVLPSNNVIDTHCRLLKELIDSGKDYEIYNSSSYAIVSLLFRDGEMKKIVKQGNVLDLIKKIQEVDSVRLLVKLKEDLFPISKEQSKSINVYISEQYKRISGVDDIYNLKDYLDNIEIAKHITQQYYNMIMPKLYELLGDLKNQIIPLLFVKAMKFLIEVNQTNQLVDKRIVKNDMIMLQEYWQNHVYSEQVSNMQIIEYGTTVESKDIKMFNECILINPILIARKCLIASTAEMIETMSQISEHAIAYMIKKMILTPMFPFVGLEVDYDSHDIDALLRKQVEVIRSDYGYKFLNVLEIDTYVAALHERYREYAAITVPMFTEEEKLYHIIEEYLGTQLLPYDENIQLGHLAQLFPLLEIQIRKLGKMFGIVPFKEQITDFMRFKDPSSVLRELLEGVYKELGSFENVPDLLFVYHYMYNGNSLNIRNECIHGRDYIGGSRLKYAFKITELALYMIILRIKTIEANIKQKDNVKKS